MPITVFLKKYGTHNNSIGIWGKALATGVPLNEAIDEARVALRSHRHDRPGEDDSFEIETNASLLGIWSGLSNTFFMATIGIAGVSLVVGGIVMIRRGAARRPMPRPTRRAQDHPASNRSDCGPGPVGEAARTASRVVRRLEPRVPRGWGRHSFGAVQVVVY